METPPTNPPAEPASAADITPRDMPTPTVPAGSGAAAAESPPATPAPSAPAAPAGEIDSAGTVYDPIRHIHKRHALTGRWMPRGGRKHKDGSPAQARLAPPASPPPPTPPSGAGAAAPEPEGEPRPPAASFIPDRPPAAGTDGEAAAPGTDGSAPAAAPAADPGQTRDTAEIACRALQFVGGLVFDASDEFTPAAKEHAHMVDTVAAYFRVKGWTMAGGLAVLAMLVAWLLKVFQTPKVRAKFREWFANARAEQARDVTGTGEPTAGAAEPAAVEVVAVNGRRIPPLAKAA